MIDSFQDISELAVTVLEEEVKSLQNAIGSVNEIFCEAV